MTAVIIDAKSVFFAKKEYDQEKKRKPHASMKRWQYSDEVHLQKLKRLIGVAVDEIRQKTSSP